MKKLEQENDKKLSSLLLKRLKKQSKVSKHTYRFSKKAIFGQEIIDAPIEINLINGSNFLCNQFFSDIKKALELNPKCIYLSFKTTRTLKAMPLLVIYSIIDKAREELLIKTKINIIWSKKSSSVNHAIKESGAFLSAKIRENSIKNATSLPVIMGDNARVDKLCSSIIDYILDNHFPDASAKKELQIGSAINETIENVGRHAYPDIENHSDKRWWFSCDRINDNLFLVIYDAGVGIPNSLSMNNAVMLSRINALYPKEFEVCQKVPEVDDSIKSKIKAIARVKVLRETFNDGQLIRSAMHTDVTSTHLPKHGQGSKSIKGLITDQPESFLLLFSNNGFYCYDKTNQESENSINNTDYKIQGTLIQWSI